MFEAGKGCGLTASTHFGEDLIMEQARKPSERAPRIGSLVLRDVEASDVGIFFTHQQDREAVHMAAFTGDDPSDREAHDAHWRRTMGSGAVTIRTIVIDGAVAGHIASFDREGDREVTYWIGREYCGSGIATRALGEFLAIERARPLHGRAAADNVASRRVLEKCGFTLAGNERGFANARGAEIDEVVMRLM
jgi:RimJ/RimL family protein N-acetyltransferase